jgi:predicted O-methyltransferase YrrM
VLELGTHTGISAACIAEGNPEGRVITVDIWGHLCREECRRPNIEYWVQDSEAAPKSAIHSVDVLFIDTIHDGVKCEKEYDRWRPLVLPGGLIFFDDITLNEEMQNWWPKWKPEEGAEKFELPVHGGAGFGAVILPFGAVILPDGA